MRSTSTSSTTRPRSRRCGDLRHRTRDRHHPDRAGKLARRPRRHADPRLRGSGGDGSACQHGGRSPRGGRELPLSAARPPLGYAARSQGEINSYLNEQTLLIAMLETPEAIENADAIAAIDGIDMLHIGSSDLSTEMGIPGQYKHARMRQAYEATARAARAHGKSMGVGGVREDLEFQTWLLQLGMLYLTGGSDVGYILSAGRADVKRLREVPLS